MSITYEEALATLQAMFAEPWTRDTLDAVLRHQKGHMENTVDLILRHGNKEPQLLIDQLDAGIDPEQSALALDEQLARQLSQAASIRNTTTNNSNTTTATGSSSSSSNSYGGKGTPTSLPDDFLRIPNYKPPSSGAYSISDDEALARMLQDELFTEELRRNPDFAHLAGRRPGGSSSRVGVAGRSNSGGTMNPGGINLPQISNPFAGLAQKFNNNLGNIGQNQNRQQQNNNFNTNTPMSPNVNIMEKLSEMGEGAKRRLQLMAAQFQANQRGGGGGGGGIGSPPLFASSSGPSTSSSTERRGLLDDNDDMELAARKDL